MKSFLITVCSFCYISVFAQPGKNIEKSITTFLKDPQFSNATVAFKVIDAASGKNIFSYNENTGVVPASSLKVITSVAAYELLGNDFKYNTGFEIYRTPEKVINLIFKGSGDPTFGSDRFKGFSRNEILQRIVQKLKSLNIKQVDNIFIDDTIFGFQPVPNGWTYEDIGNYFGAGAWGFNWNENIYDVFYDVSKNENEEAFIKYTDPAFIQEKIRNFVTVGGTGDNSIIYSSPFNDVIFIKGTLAKGKSLYKISGSLPLPAEAFCYELKSVLSTQNIPVLNFYNLSLMSYSPSYNNIGELIAVDSFLSPSFDTMNKFFLQKSINLYGESFVKSIGLKFNSENGIEKIKDYFKNIGIKESEINMIDGSGLSPSNRITASSLVKVLKYAKTTKWFPSFYNSLPTINSIKMKSGYIGGVRSYTGYLKSRSGEEYIFAFIVNNFSGSSITVKEKMFRLLDELK